MILPSGYSFGKNNSLTARPTARYEHKGGDL